MKQTIFVTAGGTGGHIFPALSVALALSQEYDVVWVGNANSLEERVAHNHQIKFIAFRMKSLRGKGVIRKLIYPIILTKAVLSCIYYLVKYKPSCVIGFGGFIAFPLLFAAKLLFKPAILHEQNAVPGLTNKVLSHLVNKVLLGFPVDGFAVNKALLVGNPVRSDILDIRKNYTDITNRDKLNIMIIGGSLGAQIFNEKLPSFLLANATKVNSVVHQVGKNNVSQVQQLYQGAPFDVLVTEFVDDMASLYKNSDLIICRSGASTVAEVAAVGIAALFIPYLYAVDDHQYYNAKNLVDIDGALLIRQQELTLEWFNQVFTNIDLALCKKIGYNASKSATPNTINDIIKQVRQVIKR